MCRNHTQKVSFSYFFAYFFHFPKLSLIHQVHIKYIEVIQILLKITDYKFLVQFMCIENFVHIRERSL